MTCGRGKGSIAKIFLRHIRALVQFTAPSNGVYRIFFTNPILRQ